LPAVLTCDDLSCPEQHSSKVEFTAHQPQLLVAVLANN
jgi:hypothetical protein